MADTGRPIGTGDVIDLLASRLDAGKMRGGLKRRLASDAFDRGVGALAGRAAGAIGDRDEARRERLQRLPRLPHGLLHLLRPGRDAFERDFTIPRAAGEERPPRTSTGERESVNT